MGSYILLAVYVVCSALALVLVKLGGGKAASVSVEGGVFGMKIGVLMLVGVVLYICSFIMSMVLVQRFDLGYYYALSAGLVYLAVTLCAFLIFKEQFTWYKLAGIVLILSGIVLVNIKK